MESHPYDWLSLAPPLVAVVVAIVTRKILPALFLGLFVGALITSQWNIPKALYDLSEIHLWNTLIEPGKLRISAFTLLIGATIGVVQASGAMRSMVGSLAKYARSRRSGQIGTWLMGLVVFFDDYANCLLLGNTMAPVCDRLKISRAKLSYIVDSTAAPVAGIALVSTWIAVELDYIREGIGNLTAEEAKGLGAFDLFVACIPYRFYVIQTLILVVMIAWTQRDLGPMLKAEQEAIERDDSLVDSSAEDASQSYSHTSDAPWWAAAIPIAIVLGVVLGLIYITGLTTAKATITNRPILLRDIFGAGDSSLALMYGGLAGVASAMILARSLRFLPGPELWQAISRGAAMVLPALAILWFASAMSRMTSNKDAQGREANKNVQYEFKDHRLYTGEFLKDKLVELNQGESGRGKLAVWLPTIIFVLASIISFCTGTSYGTMGILTPMVIPLAFASIDPGGGAMAANPIFLCCLGSVLAGAIFGDHCSPISDTTILSAQASGCDLMEHVKTQMPYALIAGGVSILPGTIAVGLGVSVWILLPLQTLAMYAILRFFGKKVKEA